VGDELSDIRQLYDGLWDASSWQAGLDHVCASLRGHHLLRLITAAAEGEERPVCWAVHAAEPHIDALIHHVDEVSTLTRVAPHRLMVRTGPYQPVIRPMSGHHGALALPFEGRFLAVCRPPTAQPFGRPEIGLLQAWLPPWRRCCVLNGGRSYGASGGRFGIIIDG
jgi:hypothetical protein